MIELTITICFAIFPLTNVIILLWMNVNALSLEFIVVYLSIIVGATWKINLTFAMEKAILIFFNDSSSIEASLDHLKVNDLYFYEIFFVYFIDICSFVDKQIFIKLQFFENSFHFLKYFFEIVVFLDGDFIEKANFYLIFNVILCVLWRSNAFSRGVVLRFT